MWMAFVNDTSDQNLPIPLLIYPGWSSKVNVRKIGLPLQFVKDRMYCYRWIHVDTVYTVDAKLP